MSAKSLSRPETSSAGWAQAFPTGVLVPILLVVLSAITWAASAATVDLRAMNDLGMVSVTPVAGFVALAVLMVSFVWSLSQQPSRPWLLLLHVLALVFMLYGYAALVSSQPRFPTAWTHAGFVEYITRTGHTATDIDARFNWPGFFALGALLTRVAGLPDAIPLLSWAPVFFNLLYLGPLFLILRAATRDTRLTWLAIWIFYLSNWIGQDYFSPQAFNYFLYLSVLGILLTWFKAQDHTFRWLTHRRPSPGRVAQFIDGLFEETEPPSRRSTPLQRVGLVAVLAGLITVIAGSHQLTPIVLVLSLTALVLFGRTSLRGLAVLAAVIVLTWIAYMTVDFMAGHFAKLLSDIGQIGGAVQENVTTRVQGSPGHMFIIYTRLGLTLALWGVAVVGGIRRYRAGRRDLTMAVLALAPFGVVFLQSYGGEMLLRVQYLGLPFMSFFAAALLLPSSTERAPALAGRMPSRQTIAVGALCVALLGGFMFARYGNERMDYVTEEEAAGLRELYRIAPPGARLVTPSPNLPWQFQNYEQYQYSPRLGEFLIGDMAALKELMVVPGRSSYLIITRSQKAHGELFRGAAPGWGDELEQALLRSPDFKQVFENRDCRIFVLANAASGASSRNGMGADSNTSEGGSTLYLPLASFAGSGSPAQASQHMYHFPIVMVTDEKAFPWRYVIKVGGPS